MPFRSTPVKRVHVPFHVLGGSRPATKMEGVDRETGSCCLGEYEFIFPSFLPKLLSGLPVVVTVDPRHPTDIRRGALSPGDKERSQFQTHHSAVINPSAAKMAWHFVPGTRVMQGGRRDCPARLWQLTLRQVENCPHERLLNRK